MTSEDFLEKAMTTEELIEEMASGIAQAMNGAEFSNNTWCSEVRRQAWRKAVQPYADKIEEYSEMVESFSETCNDYKNALGRAVEKIKSLKKIISMAGIDLNEMLTNEKNGVH